MKPIRISKKARGKTIDGYFNAVKIDITIVDGITTILVRKGDNRVPLDTTDVCNLTNALAKFGSIKLQ